MARFAVLLAACAVAFEPGVEHSLRAQRAPAPHLRRSGRLWWSDGADVPSTGAPPSVPTFALPVCLAVLWNSLSIGLLFPLWFAAAGGAGSSALLGAPLGALAFGTSVSIHLHALREGELAGGLTVLCVMGWVGWMLPLCMLRFLPPLLRSLYLLFLNEQPLQVLLSLWRRMSWVARAETTANAARAAAVVLRFRGHALGLARRVLVRAQEAAASMCTGLLRTVAFAAVRVVEVARALRLRRMGREVL